MGINTHLIAKILNTTQYNKELMTSYYTIAKVNVTAIFAAFAAAAALV